MENKKEKNWIDYKELKEKVGIEEILSHYDLLGSLKQKHDGWYGFCPIHDKDKYHKGAFNANTEKNLWYCFACGKGGDIIDFVMAKEEVDITKACELIAEWFLKAPQSSQEPLPEVKKQEPISDSGTQSKTVDTLIKEEPNPPLSFSLKNLNQDHSYLKERGLTEETIRTFGLGYCNRGIMKGRVVIPIHNEKGRFVAYAGRWPGEAPETESKYKLPLGFKKHLEVFNLNRVEDNASELIVVEGFFYCMKLWQAGYRNTVAVMGADISPKQGELIISALGKDGRVITMFDGDEAGYRGVFKALSMFLHRIFIKEIRLEKGQQPDTLTEEEIKNLLS